MGSRRPGVSMADDEYNICPDCGEKFDMENDGGNGFCIKCAQNH